MVETDDIPNKIKTWLRDLKSEVEDEPHILEELDSYLAKEFDTADSISDSQPEEAYGRILRLADLSSKAASKKPLLIRVFTKYLKRFVNAMTNVQKAMGAVSFTISVSFPFNISLSLTF